MIQTDTGRPALAEAVVDLRTGLALEEARERRRSAMAGIVLAFAVVAIGVLALAMSGCSSVPPAVADGIAILDSNTPTLSNHYRRALGGDVPSGDEAKHDAMLMSENDRLADALAKWAAAHRRGE